jgi:hypothetical protein
MMPREEKTLVWPQPNAFADAVIRAYFNRVAPGWSRGGPSEPLGAREFIELTWAWMPLFQDVMDGPRITSKCEEADEALVQLAQGEHARFSELSLTARSALAARAAVAMACAKSRMGECEDDPVMFLPAGLTKEERRIAATVRLLHDAPMVI